MKPFPNRFTPAVAPRRAPQRGVALITVLLLLMVVMLMAVAALRTANLEERVAAQVRDRQVAFQMAEAALRDGELMISSDANGPFMPLRPALFDANCTDGLCRSSPGSPRWSSFSEADWASSKAWAYGAATGAAVLQGAASEPRYVVEYQGTLQPIEPGSPCVAMFLITARARGATAVAEVILQSVYRHRAGDCHAAI